MDVDAVFAKIALDNLKELVSSLPHSERSKIADEICTFESVLCKKYNFESAFVSRESKFVQLQREIKDQKKLIKVLQKIVDKQEKEL